MIDTLGMDPEDTAYDEDMDVLLLKSERRLDMHGLTLGRMIDTLGMDPEDVVLVHDCLFTKFGEWRMEYNQHHNGHPGPISCMERCSIVLYFTLQETISQRRAQNFCPQV